MNTIRVLNLDRREYFLIQNYGHIIAYNAAVEAKSKGTNWSLRQQTQGYSQRIKYKAPIMTYGQVLLVSETSIDAALHDTLTDTAKKSIGTWHGNRIIVDWTNNNSITDDNARRMKDITETVFQLGKAYLKYDKVLI
jgi:hypothetical protein